MNGFFAQDLSGAALGLSRLFLHCFGAAELLDLGLGAQGGRSGKGSSEGMRKSELWVFAELKGELVFDE